MGFTLSYLKCLILYLLNVAFLIHRINYNVGKTFTKGIHWVRRTHTLSLSAKHFIMTYGMFFKLLDHFSFFLSQMALRI